MPEGRKGVVVLPLLRVQRAKAVRRLTCDKRLAKAIAMPICILLLLMLGGCCLTGGGSYTRESSTSNTYAEPERQQTSRTDRESVEETGTSQAYTVAAGDTLAGISKKFYGSTVYWRYIAEYNNVSDPRNLQVGQILRIPDKIGYPTRTKVRTGRTGQRETTAPSHQTEPSRKSSGTGRKSQAETPSGDEKDTLFDLGTTEEQPRDSGPTRSDDSGYSNDLDLFAIDDTEPEESLADTVSETSGEGSGEPDAAEDDSPAGTIRVTSRAALLSRPSVLDSEELSIISAGTVLKFSGTSRGYYKVIYDGHTGYIHARHVTEVNDE